MPSPVPDDASRFSNRDHNPRTTQRQALEDHAGNQNAPRENEIVQTMKAPLQDAYQALKVLFQQADERCVAGRFEIAALVRKIRDGSGLTYGRGAVRKISRPLKRSVSLLYRYARVADVWIEENVVQWLANAQAWQSVLTWSHFTYLADSPLAPLPDKERLKKKHLHSSTTASTDDAFAPLRSKEKCDEILGRALRAHLSPKQMKRLIDEALGIKEPTSLARLAEKISKHADAGFRLKPKLKEQLPYIEAAGVEESDYDYLLELYDTAQAISADWRETTNRLHSFAQIASSPQCKANSTCVE